MDFMTGMVIGYLLYPCVMMVVSSVERAISKQYNQDSAIEFRSSLKEGPHEVMRLDRKGMTYNGRRIEDAGEAYNLFVEFLKKANNRE